MWASFFDAGDRASPRPLFPSASTLAGFHVTEFQPLPLRTRLPRGAFVALDARNSYAQVSFMLRAELITAM